MNQTETTEIEPAAAGTPVSDAPEQPEQTDTPADETGSPALEHVHAPAPALNPELLREIEVEAPAEEVDKSYKKIIKRYAKLARIPGFRAGKVPDSLIRSRFARELREEVLESLVSERFRQALAEQHLQPASQPQLRDLQLTEGQPLRFKAAFEILPEIDVTGYDTVPVERPDTALTDDEFQAELDRQLDSHATVETVEEDRPLADGDWAEIRFTGKLQDLAQTVTEVGAVSATEEEPITGEDVLVEIGGKNTVPAFTEALRGTKAGQELTFEVVYPPDFGEARLAGKTVSYDVTVNAIKRKVFPERNAEFAQQLGSFDSWEEFESQLREDASASKKGALENRAKDKLLEAYVARFPFPVPETFVQQQIEARLDRGLRALAQQGMSTEQMRQLDFARLREAQRDQAVNEVKASMILDRLAEIEEVTVTDEDLERELLLMSIRAREPMDSIRERMERDGGLDRMRDQMRRERAGSVVFEKLAR